jgi:hypothetical protein
MVTNLDVIRIIDVQTFDPSEFHALNVYYFQVSGLILPVTWAEFADLAAQWFIRSYINLVRAQQSSGIRHTAVEVSNMMDYITEFYTYIPTELFAGQIIGEYPSFQDAFSLKFVRTTRATRNGSKRIPGVPETSIANGAVLPGVSTLLNVAAAYMGQPHAIEFPVGTPFATMTPVILGSPVVPPIVPTIINPVDHAEFRGLGSQNTRKHL